MASRRRAATLIAWACLACPPIAAADINSVMIAPNPGGNWDFVDTSDCVAPGGAVWSSIVYVNVDTGHGLAILGEVRDAGGVPLAGRQVNLYMAGYHAGENLHPTLLRRLPSGAGGQFRYQTPALKRNMYVWAELDPELRGGLSQACTPVAWPLLPGISDPIVIDVRPVVRIDRKKTTRGRSLTVTAKLDAVDPAHAGTVVLQSKARAGWRNVRTLHPTRTGAMTIKLAFSKQGTYRYRVRFTPKRASTDYVVGAERRFAVTVNFPSPKKHVTSGGGGGITYSPGPAVSLPDKRHSIPCQALLCK